MANDSGLPAAMPAAMLAGAVDDVESVIRAFPSLLLDLQAGQRALEARAEHVEAELSVANARLASKVGELESLRRQLESILASLPTGVIVLGATGRVERFNRTATLMLASTGRLEQGQELPAHILGLPENGTPAELRSPHAGRRVLSRRRTEVRADDGELLGTLEILDDRTAWTELTERMYQQSKMAALGTVAGGIAHEVRNPMNAVRGFAGLLTRKVSGDPELLRFARRIEEGVAEIDAIIASVLAFADPERLVPQTLSTAALAESAVELVHRDLADRGSASTWTIDLCADDVALTGDQIQLRQALRNLIANAVEAQPDGGLIRVRAESGNSDVHFIVEDAGPGIPTELIGRVRDPFFTTRAEGTGLGLALVDTIARLHGGTLEVRSERSNLGGACVVLRIPSAEPRLTCQDAQ